MITYRDIYIMMLLWQIDLVSVFLSDHTKNTGAFYTTNIALDMLYNY